MEKISIFNKIKTNKYKSFKQFKNTVQSRQSTNKDYKYKKKHLIHRTCGITNLMDKNDIIFY